MAGTVLGRYRHICFDLDGTLVHTIAPYRQRVVRQVVTSLGGPPLSDEEVDRFWFEKERTPFVAQLVGGDAARFWRRWEAADQPAARARSTFPYPDATPTLRRLRRQGKLVSVITGSSAAVAELEFAKLQAAVDCFFPIDYARFREKPDPASFSYVLAQLHVTPRETLHVGNSDEDAAFAQNAGVDFVYLERRTHPFSGRARALATVRSLDELFAL